jgi:hypothetical protein
VTVLSLVVPAATPTAPVAVVSVAVVTVTATSGFQPSLLFFFP